MLSSKSRLFTSFKTFYNHQIKSTSYSNISNDKREYFYFFDDHGQLFLEEMKIKNFTSCFKGNTNIKI
jgi:hypothetical protein